MRNTIANWYQLRTCLVPLGMGLLSPATLKVEERISCVTRVPEVRRKKTTNLQNIIDHWIAGKACFGDNQNRDMSRR
jgi:hypothetical protein